VLAAGCFLYRSWEALLIGIMGALIVCISMPLIDKMGIDDPVGASAVHGNNTFSFQLNDTLNCEYLYEHNLAKLKVFTAVVMEATWPSEMSVSCHIRTQKTETYIPMFAYLTLAFTTTTV
jgi:hypothetical protein